MTSHNINVVGAGLAECETAWQLSKGYCVNLYEMRPKKRPRHIKQINLLN